MDTKELSAQLKRISEDETIREQDRETCATAARLVMFMERQLISADQTLKAWQEAYDKLEKTLYKIEKAKKEPERGRIIYPY